MMDEIFIAAFRERLAERDLYPPFRSSDGSVLDAEGTNIAEALPNEFIVGKAEPVASLIASALNRAIGMNVAAPTSDAKDA